MTNISKPHKKPRKAVYDYDEVIRFIESKYKIKVRDFADSSSHFNKWANKKGYKGKDPAGKDRGSSQIWYAEYKKDPEGYAVCPPYQDFWHWILDQVEVERGADIDLDVAEWLDDEDVEKPEFVKTILQYLKSEFGDEIKCNVDW